MLMQSQQAFENIDLGARAIQGNLLSSLFQMSATETVEAGKAICWEGDAARHLFHITEGVVRLHRIIGDGRRVMRWGAISVYASPREMAARNRCGSA